MFHHYREGRRYDNDNMFNLIQYEGFEGNTSNSIYGYHNHGCEELAYSQIYNKVEHHEPLFASREICKDYLNNSTGTNPQPNNSTGTSSLPIESFQTPNNTTNHNYNLSIYGNHDCEELTQRQIHNKVSHHGQLFPSKQACKDYYQNNSTGTGSIPNATARPITDLKPIHSTGNRTIESFQ